MENLNYIMLQKLMKVVHLQYMVKMVNLIGWLLVNAVTSMLNHIKMKSSLKVMDHIDGLNK